MGEDHEYVLVRDGSDVYLVTPDGISKGRTRRLIRVEQDAPCVMCLTDSADPCTCVGFCGIIICGGADPA